MAGLSNNIYFVCECFLIKNYFIRKYNLHFVYNGDDEIDETSTKILVERGASSKDLKDVLQTLQNERKRRENIGRESFMRAMAIQQRYERLNAHVYTLQETFFDAKFLDIVRCAKTASRLDTLTKVEDTQCEKVWIFPVFNEQFCDDLVEEICNFEQSNLSKGRPNTMNNYGILLNELGLDKDFLDVFRNDYLSPIAKLLLPECYGDGLDSHKAFTVKYKTGEDLDLAYHFDNAEITLNVCLGREFEDGSLYFGNMRNDPVDLLRMKKINHRKGFGILHRGQHRHGAMEIHGHNAERHNLIMWMRSSSIRNKLCPMCDQQPILIEQKFCGDGFTTMNKHCNIT